MMQDGYYWVLHREGSTFIALREDGEWYVPGVNHAITDRFDVCRVIERIPQPRIIMEVAGHA